MVLLEELCPDIAPQLAAISAEVAAMAASDYRPVSEAARSIASTRGKRLRPGLLLLSARACGYDGSRCIVPAAVIEVLHGVSLVHDDVIDGADMRRGVAAARRLWGNKLSVLLGDHLLARAFRRLAELADQQVMTAIADAATEMCRGQIQEILACGPDLTEAQYFEIVSAKTASLFAASSQLGAIAAEGTEAEMATLESFGRAFGIAYQIADDILDLTATPEDAGKSVARDLAQGQITLPIIYSLSTGSAAQRAELLAALDGAPSHDIDPARVRKLIADAGGFEYAGGRVQSFADQAVRCLEPLAHSPAREALCAIARDGLAAPIVTGG